MEKIQLGIVINNGDSNYIKIDNKMLFRHDINSI